MKIECSNIQDEKPVAIYVGEEVGMQTEEFSEIGRIIVKDFDWNRDLSPWPAERMFRKGEDFAGEADRFIKQLEAEILPVLEEKHIRQVWVIGYSLAGLFALYASSKCSWINGCASVSGSLWYPGWCVYLKEHPLFAEHIYLSLGEKEKMTRNPVMQTVEQCTEETFRMVSSYADACFELNPGGHFEDERGRIRKAVRWLNSTRENLRYND